MKRLLIPVFVMLFVFSSADAAEKQIRYPYKMEMEMYGGGPTDSVVLLNINDQYANVVSLWNQGLINHTFRVDHRDSSKTLVFDTVDYYIDISDFDCGTLVYGYRNFDAHTLHDDSNTIRIIVNADLGTEIGAERGFKTIRSLRIKEHGVAAAGANTFTDSFTVSEAGAVDSLVLINGQSHLAGGCDVDSSWFRNLDVLRVRFVTKDSSTVNEKVGYASYNYDHIVAFIGRQEY